MAITIVTEKPVRQSMTTDERGPVRFRAWDVYASNDQEALNLIWNGDETSPHVKRGSVYVSPHGDIVDYALVCQSIQVRGRAPATTVSGSKGLYEVVATYGYYHTGTTRPSVPVYDGLGIPPPSVWVERALVSVVVDTQITGAPIANAVGDPLIPPSSTTEIRQTLCIRWHNQAVDWLTMYGRYQGYENKINNAPFYGFEIDCLLCTEIAIIELTAPSIGLPWFQMTGRFEHRPVKHLESGGVSVAYGGWIETRIHRGRRAKYDLPGGGTEIRVVTDSQGQPVPEPVLLKLDGYPVPPGGNPYVITFQHYDRVDFHTLGVSPPP